MEADKNQKVQPAGQDVSPMLEYSTNKIKDTLLTIGNDFCYIGFLLWEIKEYEYFKPKYKNIEQYAAAELQMKRSACYNFINICKRFSVRTQSGNPSMSLYRDKSRYSYSQLVEMLSISEKNPELMDKITPDMTRAEIRQLKKEYGGAVPEKKNDGIKIIEVSMTTEQGVLYMQQKIEPEDDSCSSVAVDALESVSEKEDKRIERLEDELEKIKNELEQCRRERDHWKQQCEIYKAELDRSDEEYLDIMMCEEFEE